jgi:hypothetical protein
MTMLYPCPSATREHVHIEYMTTCKPVTRGTYEYRFDGRRLGDVIAGTVTVKGPDGKQHTCQFLGGVE